MATGGVGLLKDEQMKRILKKYERLLPNGDRIIVEAFKVDNPIFKDGIIYTFRCMSEAGETHFAIENSHGKPHIHLKKRRFDTDWDWETALGKFDEMVTEHRKKILW